MSKQQSKLPNVHFLWERHKAVPSKQNDEKKWEVKPNFFPKTKPAPTLYTKAVLSSLKDLKLFCAQFSSERIKYELNQVGPSGDTALTAAAKINPYSHEIIPYLFACGANPHASELSPLIAVYNHLLSEESKQEDTTRAWERITLLLSQYKEYGIMCTPEEQQFVATHLVVLTSHGYVAGASSGVRKKSDGKEDEVITAEQPATEAGRPFCM
ncbi:MAG: hypothetical protein JSR33_10305 [Proteobacteria bacterium]|nr:hypothetical protein [Pseudomonadota bacterium]